MTQTARPAFVEVRAAIAATAARLGVLAFLFNLFIRPQIERFLNQLEALLQAFRNGTLPPETVREPKRTSSRPAPEKARPQPRTRLASRSHPKPELRLARSANHPTRAPYSHASPQPPKATYHPPPPPKPPPKPKKAAHPK